jgi:hypothetical protein
MAKEPVHGGTNLAVGSSRKAVVLLNGAFEPHPFGGVYRRSRGLMVLDFLDFSDIEAFADSYNFDGIEPFTLVAFEGSIGELRWDGTNLHRAKFNPGSPHIWASAQLYTPAAREKRKVWFEDLLVQRSEEIDPAVIFDFHLRGGDGDPENDMVMNRFDLVRTVSISQLSSNRDTATLRHLNLLTERESEIRI